MATEKQIVIVTNDDNNIRLDRWFKRNHPDVPFTMLVKLIRKGEIRVNGKKQESSHHILEGDSISFPRFSIAPATAQKSTPVVQRKYVEEIKAAILFMDDDIIVINKPIGLAVQGGSNIQVSLDDLAEKLKFGYEQKPKLVHRLDKETSGIIIMARKTNVAAELSELFRTKQIAKQYLALVSGLPRPYEGIIDIPLEKKYETENFEKTRKSDTGKKAVTLYKMLDHAGDVASLVQLDLVTGRTHQIRAHMSLIGNPIFGDDKYGDEVSRREKKLFLHSYKTEFVFNGKTLSFTADLPPHFKEKLAFLGLQK